jgi:hypothetical protein
LHRQEPIILQSCSRLLLLNSENDARKSDTALQIEEENLVREQSVGILTSAFSLFQAASRPAMTIACQENCLPPTCRTICQLSAFGSWFALLLATEGFCGVKQSMAGVRMTHHVPIGNFKICSYSPRHARSESWRILF